MLIPTIIKWATDPRVIKGAAIALALSIIFGAGCRTQAALDEAKILRLNNKIQTLDENNDLCLENLERVKLNWTDLKEAVETTNEEVRKMGEEYNARVVQLEELNRAAVSHLVATHTEAMRDMVEEANALRERMADMSAAEACHEAMLEIVK